MKKKLFFAQMLVILTVLFIMGIGAAASSTMSVDNSQGVLRVSYSMSASDHIKVKVAHGGNTYYYDLTRSEEAFPLQFGNGDYSVALYQLVQGNEYRVLTQTNVTVSFGSEQTAFLGSMQVVNWNEAMAAIKKAHALAKGAGSADKKIEILYSFVSKNVKYDYPKAASIAAGYIPSVESTYETKKGICYDYSALFGAMLRCEGIPSKLMKGYKSDMSEYHAWNQVYMDGKWVTIDTTYDSSAATMGLRYQMIKSNSEYRISKYY